MPPTIRKEATPVIFNTRTAWMIKLTVREASDIFQNQLRAHQAGPALTRPTTPSHQTAIEKYLAETQDWAFDTITIAAPAGAIAQASKIIQLDPKTLVVLDGQHRLKAILGFLKHLETAAPADRSNRIQNRLTAFLRDELPFLLYEVRDTGELRHLFQTFSNRRPFDPSDPRNQPQAASDPHDHAQDPAQNPTGDTGATPLDRTHNRKDNLNPKGNPHPLPTEY